MSAGPRAEGPVWQNLEFGEFTTWSGLPVESYALEQHSGLEDGLARDWPRADAAVDKHRSYALQWYSLAALSVALVMMTLGTLSNSCSRSVAPTSSGAAATVSLGRPPRV